jgi:hypothetical protein
MKMMFNVSFLDPKTGMRTLFGAAQGRHMHRTREQAETYLAALRENTGKDRLESIAGLGTWDSFRVDPFMCYDHGDPVGRYVFEAK